MALNQFNAQHYLKMSPDKFHAEAKRLGVDLYGKSRNQQVDAVYNAELRRRSEEAAEREAQGIVEPGPIPAPIDGEGKQGYEELTVAELRELADERSIDLGDSTRKADIIEVIQLADLEAEENAAG